MPRHMRSAAIGAAVAVSVALNAGMASAITVDFSSGTLESSTKTYTESGFVFAPVSLTSGLCPGASECLLQNIDAFSDVTMTMESGLPFDLLSFSYHFVGDERQQRSELTVSDSTSLTIRQQSVGNDPFTVNLGNLFLGVSEITFSYSGFGSGSGRLDDVVSQMIPVPAALPLFLAALGGLGFLGWRRGARLGRPDAAQ